MSLDQTTPFWGPVTSSIDWCEANYVISRYIAEPANTISNLSFVIFGLLGAWHEYSEKSKRSYIVMYLTTSLIGVGSMLFHGTLTVWGQQADELPMVWHLLMCMFFLHRESFGGGEMAKSVTTGLITIYAILFSILHILLKTTTAFQVHFGVLLTLVLFRLFTKFRSIDPGPEGRQLITLFFCSGFTGFACWLLDYHQCSWVQSLPINPQGHVWWHLLMGYSAYTSIVVLKVLECQQGGKQVNIVYRHGLPFAHRKRSACTSCIDLEALCDDDDDETFDANNNNSSSSSNNTINNIINGNSVININSSTSNII